MVLVCLAVALVCLGISVYGDAGLWCWIANEYPYHQLGFFYSFVCASWIVSIYCLVAVQGVENTPIIVMGKPGDGSDLLDSPRTQAAKEEASSAARESAAAVRSRLAKYLFSFIFIWIFGLTNRIVGAVQYEMQFEPVWALAFLHVLFVPLQGFLNGGPKVRP